MEVRGLRLPEQPEGLDEAPAGALFLAHARQARAGRPLDPADRPHVYRLCHLLGGLPLALIQAAEWLRLLPPAELVADVERGLDLGPAGAGGSHPEPWRSLHTALEDAWRRLTPDEQGVLRRLAVFAGPFARSAAVSVAGATPDALLALADGALLEPDGHAPLRPPGARAALRRGPPAGARPGVGSGPGAARRLLRGLPGPAPAGPGPGRMRAAGGGPGAARSADRPSPGPPPGRGEGCWIPWRRAWASTTPWPGTSRRAPACSKGSPPDAPGCSWKGPACASGGASRRRPGATSRAPAWRPGGAPTGAWPSPSWPPQGRCWSSPATPAPGATS